MNEVFNKLEEEKRLRIINSGLEVFSKLGYKKASTELIAHKAGISKGLLFYYFRNKITYFTYLFEYAKDLISKSINIELCKSSTDFFEILEYITEEKCKLLKRNPHILNFVVMAYCSNDEKILDMISNTLDSQVNVYEYFINVDKSKFKDDLDIGDILEMISLMLDGYLQSKLKSNENIDIDEVMNKYKKWTLILKHAVYK